MKTINLLTLLSLSLIGLNACQQPAAAPAAGETNGGSSSSTAAATSGSASQAQPGLSSFGLCESNANPIFTSPVVDPQYVHSVSPIPALAMGVQFEGRSYIMSKEGLDGVRIPVYAPVRMKLIAAKNYAPDGVPAGYVSDWALAFEASCEISIGFAHIKEVSPRIAAVNVAPFSNSSAPVQTSEAVTFEAGEIIGYYIRGLNSIAFDFIINNTQVTNQFANQARYEVNSHKLLTVVCPWDFFTSDLKQTYYGLLAGPGGTPNASLGMGCGTVEQDRRGTIAGSWFANADTSEGAFDSRLAAFLGTDNIVYVGNYGFSTMKLNSDNPTYLDPANITSEHCYQDYSGPGTPSGYAYFRVVSAAEMQVARVANGLCPANFPQDQAVTYFR